MVTSWHFPILWSTGKGDFLQLNLNLFLLLINICFSHYTHAISFYWKIILWLKFSLGCCMAHCSVLEFSCLMQLLLLIFYAVLHEDWNVQIWSFLQVSPPKTWRGISKPSDSQYLWIPSTAGLHLLFSLYISCWLICFKYSARLVTKSVVAGWKGMPVLCKNRAMQVWCHL